jgi:hypothetical protein
MPKQAPVPPVPAVDDLSPAEATAAQNRERMLVYLEAADRMRRLAARALDTIESALEDDDPRIRLAAAALIVKASKLHELGPPIGPVTVREVERDRALARLLDSM